MKQKNKIFYIDMNSEAAFKYAGLVENDPEDEEIMLEAWQKSPNGSLTSRIAETARLIKIERDKHKTNKGTEKPTSK